MARKKTNKRPNFEYRKRTKKDIERRANMSGGDFDSYINRDFDLWTPDSGDNRIRIMPPTFDGADNYGIDIWVHYRIGADENSYLCLDKHGQDNCPICEARTEANKRGDGDYAKELAPCRRVLVWMIDRNGDEVRPKLWAMPQSLDKDFSKLSLDKSSGEILDIDHPDEGYDLLFTREGMGIKTEYTGKQVARRSTPLSNDEEEMEEWLDYIIENPLPDTLQFYDHEHVSKVFSGKAVNTEEVTDDPEGEDPEGEEEAEDGDETEAPEGADAEEEGDPRARRKARLRERKNRSPGSKKAGRRSRR